MAGMTRIKMHAGEVDTSGGLVQRLVADQFPQWAGRSIRPIESYGTDHDIYRLGDDLVARLPRIRWATSQAAREAAWLPRLAPHLPLALPTPMGIGRPGHGYPYEWSVCTWLPGANANGSLTDLDAAAVGLAGFIGALQGIDTTVAPPRKPGSRGAPLAENADAGFRAIDELGSRIDQAAARRSWRESLEAVPHHGPSVWVHGDLLPGNLIVRDGRLTGVIDFGGLNVGDPACDLQPAWNVFAGPSRQRFRAELDVDDSAWLRGRGWALLQAVVALPYYWDTNPGFVAQTSHALREVLAEG